MILTEKLSRLISLLPDKPGVYQMKDAGGKIIYIGKAKNLKKRVSQYFLRPQIGKVKAMVEHVDSFDIIAVEKANAFYLDAEGGNVVADTIRFNGKFRFLFDIDSENSHFFKSFPFVVHGLC